MKVRVFAVLAAIGAALAVGATPVSAVGSVNDGQLGGPPSPSFIPDSTVCPAGQAVTGVVGATRVIGGFINIVAVATVQCSGGGPGTTMGSGTGLPGATSCPAGQVAVGIVGREGDFIDQLNLLCRNADGSGLVTPSLGMLGGGLGVPDVPYLCPGDQVLTGLRGQSVPDTGSGRTIRFVAIVCGPAPGDDNNGGGEGGDKGDKGDHGDNGHHGDGGGQGDNGDKHGD